MKDDMLAEYGNPVDLLRQGGVTRRLTILGWSDLYAEEVLILKEPRLRT
jgi:hypothetical protein